jgi:threonine/homoserine/homoserine lactone efflux protein
MINYFIFGISYAFAAVIQPGPFQAFLFSNSVRNGWRKTIPLVLAPLISDLPVIILVVFLLTKVPHSVLGILQCLGGIFLLFLAWRGYKSLAGATDKSNHDLSEYENLFRAVLVNIFNPAPYLAWSLIMGPVLIRAFRESRESGIVLLTSFYGSMIIYSSLMVMLFSAAGNLGPRINRILVVISIIAFVVFGFYQLWSGISGFM